jgi:hypothetical protein
MLEFLPFICKCKQALQAFSIAGFQRLGQDCMPDFFLICGVSS